MDFFPDERDMEPIPRRSSRYSRDHDRDFYDRRDPYDLDRDLDYPPRPSFPPPFPDDPLFRGMARPLLPHPRDDMPLYKEPLSEGAIALNSVVLIPMNPLEPKPKQREKPRVCKTVFVGSLPENCTDKNLIDLFTPCGAISDVRVSRGRNFGHVQFNLESSVSRAMDISGCKVKIENSSNPKDCGRIHVDYAQDKVEIDLKRRIQDNDMLSYNSKNSASVSLDLHKENVFCYAAKNVTSWLSKGSCDAESVNTFFGLINNVNSRGRKLLKTIQDKEEEELEFRIRRQEFYKKLTDECKLILDVYEAAASGVKTWNIFTKAQRKSITQWKEQALDIQERLRVKLGSGSSSDETSDEATAPPSKAMKMDTGDADVEAKLERAQREIEQLKVDREVAVEKKDKQILQLKTLLAKFKKTCPEEWEKALGVTTDTEKMESNDDTNKAEGADEAKEVIEGVSLDDLNVAMDKDASENSLASAAAAYAEMRKTVGSTEMTGSGISEAEVAIVAVLSAFLTVHPLGATIEAITSYFQTFNPAYNSYYLESFLRRLAKVFQSGEGGKWWFLGFQTATEVKSEKASS